jgi:hypothetical protein
LMLCIQFVFLTLRQGYCFDNVFHSG